MVCVKTVAVEGMDVKVEEVEGTKVQTEKAEKDLDEPGCWGQGNVQPGKGGVWGCKGRGREGND